MKMNSSPKKLIFIYSSKTQIERKRVLIILWIKFRWSFTASQRPCFSGPMTRHTQSFKHNNNHGTAAVIGGALITNNEVELQINSLRSEEVLEPALERKHGHHLHNHVFQRVSWWSCEGFSEKTTWIHVAVDFGFREKKKVGCFWWFMGFVCLWMFLRFVLLVGLDLPLKKLNLIFRKPFATKCYGEKKNHFFLRVFEKCFGINGSWFCS